MGFRVIYTIHYKAWTLASNKHGSNNTELACEEWVLSTLRLIWHHNYLVNFRLKTYLSAYAPIIALFIHLNKVIIWHINILTYCFYYCSIYLWHLKDYTDFSNHISSTLQADNSKKFGLNSDKATNGLLYVYTSNLIFLL